MSTLFGNVDHWLERAEEARAMAEQISDPDAKQAMFDIAVSYERIAKRAEARDAGVPLPPSKSE